MAEGLFVGMTILIIITTWIAAGLFVAFIWYVAKRGDRRKDHEEWLRFVLTMGQWPDSDLLALNLSGFWVFTEGSMKLELVLPGCVEPRPQHVFAQFSKVGQNGSDIVELVGHMRPARDADVRRRFTRSEGCLDENEPTDQAIADWQFWAAQGYLF